MTNPFFDYPEPEGGESTAAELNFLPHWDEDRWSRLLGFTEHRRFLEGDLVIREGDRDSSVFILTLGSLQILMPSRGIGKWRMAGTVTAGAVIGEQAFLDGQPRSATLRALTDGEMVALSRDAFDLLSQREPELAMEVLMDLARTLSIRLRKANDFISGRIK